MSGNGNKQIKVWVRRTGKEDLIENVTFIEGEKELYPDVGKCKDCNTDYEYISSTELTFKKDDPNFGFIRYTFKCSGCPEENQKATKTIKIFEKKGGNSVTNSTAA